MKTVVNALDKLSSSTLNHHEEKKNTSAFSRKKLWNSKRRYLIS
ncbi:hypothetical protein LX95_02479 [Mesonia algae]|uniref:Uncharacterized protein n=1 Tax=Mesonia algae TaxID=213248 RepID=A0A2W7I024_9FLAO|nr:hypothetical protein [Mesonia algae]PZW38812.1 hypothetical protein LX95_02479 [Mesonia algae]